MISKPSPENLFFSNITNELESAAMKSGVFLVSFIEQDARKKIKKKHLFINLISPYLSLQN